MDKRLRMALHASSVERYHAFRGRAPQTVGHHTFRVMAILHSIVANPSAGLLLAAMYHDVPEAVTGDIPFDAKRDYPDLKACTVRIENELAVAHSLPMEVSADELRALKLADWLEMALFAEEQVETGNTRYTRVAAKCVKLAIEDVMENDLPECVRYVSFWHIIKSLRHFAEEEVTWFNNCYHNRARMETENVE